MREKAVILLSGGLDSTTCLAMAKDQQRACYTLSFDYGQKQRAELEAAQQISHCLGAIAHKVIPLTLGQLTGSALTDPDLVAPAYTGEEKIPVTYVPARNTIFLSIALGWAEALQAKHIFTGTCAIDYSHYPDCRPAYIDAFQKMANLATKTGVNNNPIHIHTPLLYLSKSEAIKEGLRLGVDYSMTISCYRADSQGRACGQCDSCTLRARGFHQAGIADPTRYVC